MDKNNIRQISLKEVWELPWVSWNLVKENYTQALIIGLILMACNSLNYIPLFGIVLKAFFSVFIACGVLELCRAWEAKKTTEFSQFFISFTDRSIANHILPLAGFNVVLSIVIEFLSDGLGLIFGTASLIYFALVLILSAIHGAFTSFSTALLYFHKQMNLKKALLLSLKIYAKNFVALFMSGTLLMTIACLSLLLLFFPLIFFFIPLSVPITYYLYRATCEGLTLQSEKELKEVSPS